MTPSALAIAAWNIAPSDTIERLYSGLINTTWRISPDNRPPFILQRLNTSIFQPSVHLDMQGIGEHLQSRGVDCPRLLTTSAGALWLTEDQEVWRAMTYVGEETHEAFQTPQQATSAGVLVARFHEALVDFPWDFHHIRAGAHDTPEHLRTLTKALQEHRDHPLYDQVAPLAERLDQHWQTLSSQLPTTLPTRIIHGDLKVSNLRFSGGQASALVDLDTLAHSTLDLEIGDALRSWCNPAKEDAGASRFDLQIFTAAMKGYVSGFSTDVLTSDEWDALVLGLERISLELAARFAADALSESYFGWDPTRFATRGEHNLLRAQGQWSLCQSVIEQRAQAEATLKALRQVSSR